MDTFYFVRFEERKIDNNKFLVLHVLDYEKSIVFQIYKKYSSDVLNILSNTERFSNITSIISFAIKPNGKIGLDIII